MRALFHVEQSRVRRKMFHVEHAAASALLPPIDPCFALPSPSSSCHSFPPGFAVQFAALSHEREPMDAPNASIGRAARPTAAEAAPALGQSAILWDELVNWLVTEMAVEVREWKSISPQVWLGAPSQAEEAQYRLPRPLHRVCPGLHCPRRQGSIRCAHQQSSSAVIKALSEAPHFGEGTGLRLIVRRQKDLAGIRKLTTIKLAN